MTDCVSCGTSLEKKAKTCGTCVSIISQKETLQERKSPLVHKPGEVHDIEPRLDRDMEAVLAPGEFEWRNHWASSFSFAEMAQELHNVVVEIHRVQEQLLAMIEGTYEVESDSSVDIEKAIWAHFLFTIGDAAQTLSTILLIRDIKTTVPASLTDMVHKQETSSIEAQNYYGVLSGTPADLYERVKKRVLSRTDFDYSRHWTNGESFRELGMGLMTVQVGLQGVCETALEMLEGTFQVNDQNSIDAELVNMASFLQDSADTIHGIAVGIVMTDAR